MTPEPATVTPPVEVTSTEMEAVTNGCPAAVNGSATEETAVVNGCDGDTMEVTAADAEIKVRRMCFYCMFSLSALWQCWVRKIILLVMSC